MEEEKVHKRRVRYKGTHPKKFHEKYKELEPEKYSEDVAKLIEKGRTPAGMHISICVNEILDFLQIKKGQVGLDATLGYGGHSSKMLEKLDGEGHLHGLDVDPIEMPKTVSRLRNLGFGEDVFTAHHLNFAKIDEILPISGPLNFMMADLGVSSMQIDNPERGFTYKHDGALDLRLNPETGISAAERLAEVDKEELIFMLRENADEPYAEEIAKAVFKAKKGKKAIKSTRDFYNIIVEALSFLPPKERDMAVKKSAQRCFQALRIDVNTELEVLYDLLEKLPTVMAPGGRIAILTFHSGEDRLVKKSFKALHQAGVYSDIATEVIRASAEECFQNSRARSAKLRWAIMAE